MIDSIDLGLVKAIHIGLTAPTNTAMLWYDSNTGVKLHKYYDTVTSIWKTLISNLISIIEITWEDLNVIKEASTLLVGAVYKITDRFNYQSGGSVGIPNLSFLGDDRGLVYIKALEVNVLSKEVIRVMACPLSYSNTINAVASIGVWRLTKTVVSGNKTIWGGKVWTNNTGVIGTSVNSTKLDIVNWTLVSKSSTPSFYEDKQFRAVYDFDNDWFEKQYDGKGNEFGVPFAGYFMNSYPYNFNPCDISDWNQKQTGIYGSSIENNKCNGVFNNISQTIINNHFVGHINHCGLGDIVGNVLSRPLFYNIENLGGSGFGFSLYNNEYTQGGSEIYPADLDITGLTTIDLSGIGLGLTPYLFVKRINLISTNPTETITIFSANCFQSGFAHSIEFTASSGLEVTFTHGAPSMSPPYQPLCEGGINAVINGANNDWVEFELFNNGVRQKSIGKYS